VVLVLDLSLGKALDLPSSLLGDVDGLEDGIRRHGQIPERLKWKTRGGRGEKGEGGEGEETSELTF